MQTELLLLMDHEQMINQRDFTCMGHLTLTSPRVFLSFWPELKREFLRATSIKLI